MRKNSTRILALAVVVVLVVSTLVALFTTAVKAAPNHFRLYSVYYTSTKREITNLRSTTNGITVKFTYADTLPNFLNNPDSKKEFEFSNTDFSVDLPWYNNASNSRLKMEIGSEYPTDGTETYYNIAITIDNLKYDYTGTNNTFSVSFNNTELDYHPTLNTQLPDSVFARSGSSSDDPEDIPAPDIVVESVVVYDRSGNQVTEVEEDDVVHIDVTYTDYGLRKYRWQDYDEEMQVFITSTTGLIPTAGTRGSIRELSTFTDDVPRFRATFRNVRFDGTANVLTFRTQYLINGDEYVKGEGTATVYQAKTDSEKKDDLAPLTPHIIVNQYSYGGEPVAAGEDFTLNISIRNTSTDIPLENIVMTIQPLVITSTSSNDAIGGLTITSASNTFYIDSLPVGATMSHSIDLRAEPNAAVGSHNVEVKFKFQYVDDVNKKREDGEDNENIAIPVTQIDRFSVDPLTQLPYSIMTGQEEYITVTFINRGKSTTYNISGTITGNLDGSGQSQHFGNLEAGKAGELDFEVLSFEPGEIIGEITIEYEDENTMPNEVTLPFSIQVEEPYYEPMFPPDDLYPMDEQTGPNVLSIVLCIVGGILLAVPIALYLFKRVKAKGIEEFDETF